MAPRLQHTSRTSFLHITTADLLDNQQALQYLQTFRINKIFFDLTEAYTRSDKTQQATILNNMTCLLDALYGDFDIEEITLTPPKRMPSYLAVHRWLGGMIGSALTSTLTLFGLMGLSTKTVESMGFMLLTLGSIIGFAGGMHWGLGAAQRTKNRHQPPEFYTTLSAFLTQKKSHLRAFSGLFLETIPSTTAHYKSALALRVANILHDTKWSAQQKTALWNQYKDTGIAREILFLLPQTVRHTLTPGRPVLLSGPLRKRHSTQDTHVASPQNAPSCLQQ